LSLAALPTSHQIFCAFQKIFGNEILTLLSDEKLEMNCSLPISKKVNAEYVLSKGTQAIFELSENSLAHTYVGVFILPAK